MSAHAEEVERYVLDACVLIAYLNDEVGTKVVEDLLALATQERAQCFVAAVNVYELFYDCLKRDAATARQLVDDIYSLSITVVEALDRLLMQDAGAFKVAYRSRAHGVSDCAVMRRRQAGLASGLSDAIILVTKYFSARTEPAYAICRRPRHRNNVQTAGATG